MSDEAADTSTDHSTDTAPGSGAGDAAHTAQIPRIDRDSDAGGQTDKGRPRPAGSGSTKAVAPKKASAAKPGAPKSGTPKSGPAKTTPKKPKSADSGPTARPLTASDYARTTAPSPSTTAVIPAVEAEREAPSKKAQTATQSVQLAEPRNDRAATLRLSYIEPWSVTCMAFAISVAMMIVAVVAATIFWVVLDVTGVWDQIDGSVTSVLSDDTSTFQITDYLGFTRLVGLALVLSALNVVIMTVLATIAAHLYNLAAQLLGGFQMTYTSQD